MACNGDQFTSSKKNICLLCINPVLNVVETDSKAFRNGVDCITIPPTARDMTLLPHGQRGRGAGHRLRSRQFSKFGVRCWLVVCYVLLARLAGQDWSPSRTTRSATYAKRVARVFSVFSLPTGLATGALENRASPSGRQAPLVPHSNRGFAAPRPHRSQRISGTTFSVCVCNIVDVYACWLERPCETGGGSQPLDTERERERERERLPTGQASA